MAKEEANLTGADADVASGHVHVRTDMAVQLAHEGLAETHDFRVALALGVEIRATLAAAHGQRGQGVFEGLFKRQELQHPQIHRRVEAQATFVRANGAVHLNAEATVNPHFAFVIHP